MDKFMRGKDKRIIMSLLRGFIVGLLGGELHTVRDNHGRPIATIESFSNRKTR